jgi:hypothetical protein
MTAFLYKLRILLLLLPWGSWTHLHPNQVQHFQAHLPQRIPGAVVWGPVVIFVWAFCSFTILFVNYKVKIL